MLVNESQSDDSAHDAANGSNDMLGSFETVAAATIGLGLIGEIAIDSRKRRQNRDAASTSDDADNSNATIPPIEGGDDAIPNATMLSVAAEIMTGAADFPVRSQPLLSPSCFQASGFWLACSCLGYAAFD